MSLKAVFPLICIAFGAIGLHAQNLPVAPEEKNDPEAKKVLDRVRKKYEGYKSIEVTFNLTIQLPEQAKQVQKGTIGQEGDKFRLEMADQVIVDDTKSTWVYLPKNKEVQINNSEPGQNSDAGFVTPRDLLRRYQKGDFLYAIIDKVSEGTRVLTQIEFKPKSKSSEYSKIRVSIDEKAGTIQRIEAFAKDGSRYTFNITRFTPNKAFEAGYFSFDTKKYPNVHVEDLRM